MACGSSLGENAAARVRNGDEFGVIERYDIGVTDREENRTRGWTLVKLGVTEGVKQRIGVARNFFGVVL